MKNLLTITLLLCLSQVRAQVDITGFQYWFDQDHSASNWVDVPHSSSINELPSIPVTGLAIGPHRFNIRLKDSNGHWSSVLSRSFHVQYAGPFEIVALRYWSDQVAMNPGDLREFVLDSPAEVLDILTDIEFCQQQLGAHNVFFQLKDNHGLWSSVLTREISVDAIGPPAAPVTIQGPSYVLPGESVMYTVDTVAGATGYAWTLPADWSGSSTANAITATAGATLGVGAIGVVALNGCGASDTTFLDISTDIANHFSPGTTHLYPNPNAGQFFLELHSTAQVAVFDASGRQITAEQVLQGTRHPVDIGDAPDGVYSVRIIQDGRVEVRRFIIQH